MGCNFFSSARNYTPPNPNPYDYKVKSIEVFGDYLVAEVEYPSCVESERVKILLLEGTESIVFGESLDPHFVNQYLLARFRNNSKGKENARKLAQMLKDVE